MVFIPYYRIDIKTNFEEDGYPDSPTTCNVESRQIGGSTVRLTDNMQSREQTDRRVGCDLTFVNTLVPFLDVSNMKLPVLRVNRG